MWFLFIISVCLIPQLCLTGDTPYEKPEYDYPDYPNYQGYDNGDDYRKEEYGNYGDYDYTNEDKNQMCPMCAFVHPQVAYCTSQIVAKIKIRAYEGQDGSAKIYYIEVKDVIKGDFNKYFISTLSAVCKISFQEKKTYLVMGSVDGNKLNLGACDYVSSMQDMNCFQRKGIFHKEYAANCKCVDMIGAAASSPCNTAEKKPSCYADFAECKVRGSGCGWQKFWKFQECV